MDAVIVTGGSQGTTRLTKTEWELLERLIRHPGQLITQRQLLTDRVGKDPTTAAGN